MASSVLGSSPPTKYGIVLFRNFQLLDAAGPLDILNILAKDRELSLSIIAATKEPVSTLPADAPDNHNASPGFSQSVMPTHTFDDAPEDIEVLLVPGGRGTRYPEIASPAVEYIKRVYPKLRYLITVCTGSVLVAKAGLLQGKRATSNKMNWKYVTETNPGVEWQPSARWVVDGNIWTSSGISAGIDVMYAFVSAMYGEQVAQLVADASEYIRNTDASTDPFAKRWNTIGA